ncbi:MAG: single-stranded DNA-binding protein [Candidatus Hydrogenedentes bacterium]|nr:single-stranded DNA-binding protein [Candidatus Hydrogenedentota bacterium]
MEPRQITDALIRNLETLTFGTPVTCAYNPLVYARRSHDEYLNQYGQRPKEILLLGMNPGPFGMAQTGVPFGDIAMVRDWLGISAPVGKPDNEHPKRPVTGFDCHRSEVSGTRLWGWARTRFKEPREFFARFFVLNYCPLCFIEESGRNRTPDKLPAAEKESLFEACDTALKRYIEWFQPRYVIGVGRFAESRAKAVLDGKDLVVDRIPHPSPANPAANRGWAEYAEKALRNAGVKL